MVQLAAKIKFLFFVFVFSVTIGRPWKLQTKYIVVYVVYRTLPDSLTHCVFTINTSAGNKPLADKTCLPLEMLKLIYWPVPLPLISSRVQVFMVDFKNALAGRFFCFLLIFWVDMMKLKSISTDSEEGFRVVPMRLSEYRRTLKPIHNFLYENNDAITWLRKL